MRRFQEKKPAHDMEEQDPALAEAIRRSVEQRTREEALLADAIAASLVSLDEELARQLQRRINTEDSPISASRLGPETPEAAYLEDVAVQDALARSREQQEEQKWTRVVKRNKLRAAAAHPPPPNAVAASQGPVKVVLDGLNVGCTLGGAGGKFFRARGIEIALNYFRARGLRAVALLPRNKVDGSVSTRALADDVDLLLRLEAEHRVFFTPPEVSDDNFILRYAFEKNADLVSNDNFLAEIHRQRGRENVRGLKNFLRHHRIPFSFIVDEFHPNPNPSAIVDGRVHHPQY